MGIYIQSVAQISAQEPLSWDFLTNPIHHQDKLVSCKMPDSKVFISSSDARRMDNLLKRAIITAKIAIENAHITTLDAIIAGTGLGCMDNTLHFLQDMITYHEDMLSPTFFMKSTHNTIASQMACFLHCHAYNTTFSHGTNSFESALLDTLMQFQLHNIHTALVGAYDEIPTLYFNWLEQLKQYKKEENNGFASETSISFVFSDKKTISSWCELKDITIAQNSIGLPKNIETFLSKNNLSINQIDTIILGMDKTAPDQYLYQTACEYFKNHNIMIFKHIFGHSYTSSAIGVLIGALSLQQQKLFAPLTFSHSSIHKEIKNILVFNYINKKSYSLILLSVC